MDMGRSYGNLKDALIHFTWASPILSVRRPQDHRRRQTGRLSRRWAEGMRTDRIGPKGDVQKARRLRRTT